MPLTDKHIQQLADLNSQGTQIGALKDSGGSDWKLGLYGSTPRAQYAVGVAPNVSPGANGQCATDAANGITLSGSTPSLNDVVRCLKLLGLIA